MIHLLLYMYPKSRWKAGVAYRLPSSCGSKALGGNQVLRRKADCDDGLTVMIMPKLKKTLHPTAVGYSFRASVKLILCSCSIACRASSPAMAPITRPLFKVSSPRVSLSKLSSLTSLVFSVAILAVPSALWILYSGVRVG